MDGRYRMSKSRDPFTCPSCKCSKGSVKVSRKKREVGSRRFYTIFIITSLPLLLPLLFLLVGVAQRAKQSCTCRTTMGSVARNGVISSSYLNPSWIKRFTGPWNTSLKEKFQNLSVLCTIIGMRELGKESVDDCMSILVQFSV